MIHTKSLIRRLAYVPWLLAFGLVLGWAGEAQAQDIRLTGGKSVREDAGATTITVKATNYDVPGSDTKTNVGAATYVILDVATAGTPDASAGRTALNSRYNVTLGTIVIPKDKNEGTVDITFTPIKNDAIGNPAITDDDDNDPDNEANLDVYITGVAGSAFTVTDAGRTLITLIDKDQVTNRINLSFSPSEISQEAGSTEITVTATVDGELVKSKKLDIPLVVVGASAWRGPNTEDTLPEATAPEGDEATRDAHYNLPSLPTVTIPKNRLSGKATFTIDPKSGPRWVGIGTPTTTDLRYDNVTPTADPDRDGDGNPATNNNADGTLDAGGFTKEEQEIEVIPNHLTISEKKVSELKGDDAEDEGLKASPDMIREEVGETSINLKIILARTVTDDEAVVFSITGSRGGTRDIHYTASFTDLTIPAGEIEGEATLTLTPFANTGTIEIDVEAKVDNSTQTETITIVDTDVSTTDITLSADPGSIMEDAGETDVTITATLNALVLEEDAKLTLVLGNMVSTDDDGDGATATRDVDYTAVIRSVTIAAGEVSGSTTVSITPVDDGVEDVDETIKIKSSNKPKNDIGDDIAVSVATITLKDTGVREDPDAPVDMTPAFTEDDIAASDTVIEGVVGTALEQVLPEATGDGTLTYTVSASLPGGLSFDAATRTLSGTPTAAGDAEIVYTVVDGDTGDALPAESAALTYNFEIAEKPDPTTEVVNVSVSQSSVRESGDSASISVKATLAGPAPVAETIRFTLGAPSEGVQAVRDVDFSATLHGNVAIAEGATEATTSLTLTPIDNANTDGNRVVGVHAMASGGSASADVTIADDETASTSISLSANPHTVSEADGNTELTITATLDGKVLDADAEVTLSVDSGSEATRDVDYRALFLPVLTIPAGEVSGSTSLFIDPISDEEDEGNETITLNGAIDGLENGTGLITISDYVVIPPPIDPLAFAEGAMIDTIEATAGAPIPDADTQLPEATGGSGGDISYSVSELPAGLSFDAETRTLSGTPEAEGTTEVTYTATAGEESVSLTFSIKVNPELDFEQLNTLFGLFEAAGKANPADEHDEGALQLTVGVPVELTLPEIPGGTGEKTYSMSGLPAGLSFDGTTRTISGTPTEEGLAIVILTVTDAVGATGQVPVPVSVVQPPLDAPGILPDEPLADDYKGADGEGDQGGFILLSWELSDDHDNIDGYRIFRTMPVLNNEEVPWAFVDAVPGVEKGRAIVATLDNVSTLWGIAAERGGRTTHGAAKAVFVDAENPYGLMAETMMASREAAQAGDGPVFASLLPAWLRS
ncbi:MAG: putative Ig domain-containing protein [Candidatus Latescibacteria bacterium]|nr:putative Ig domain-containing protein [Candidatus Latescibacterota bacterium]